MDSSFSLPSIRYHRGHHSSLSQILGRRYQGNLSAPDHAEDLFPLCLSSLWMLLLSLLLLLLWIKHFEQHLMHQSNVLFKMPRHVDNRSCTSLRLPANYAIIKFSIWFFGRLQCGTWKNATSENVSYCCIFTSGRTNVNINEVWLINVVSSVSELFHNE